MMFDTEKLICLIEHTEIIWNVNLKGCNDKKRKTKAWYEVTRAMYPDWETFSLDKMSKAVADCQKKWKNIKDYYIKELRWEKKRLAGEEKIKRHKYIYFDLLNFLSSTVDHKRFGAVLTNLGSTSTSEPNNRKEEYLNQYVETSMDDSLSAEEKYQVPISQTVDLPASENSSLEAIKSQAHNNLTATFYEESTPPPVQKRKLESTFEDIDDDKAFLMSLLPILRNFDDMKKIDFRIQVLTIMKQFQEQGTSNSN